MTRRYIREADLPELEWAATKAPLFDQPALNQIYEAAERILEGRDASSRLERPLTEGESYLIAVAELVPVVIKTDPGGGLILLPGRLSNDQ